MVQTAAMPPIAAVCPSAVHDPSETFDTARSEHRRLISGALKTDRLFAKSRFLMPFQKVVEIDLTAENIGIAG